MPRVRARVRAMAMVRATVRAMLRAEAGNRGARARVQGAWAGPSQCMEPSHEAIPRPDELRLMEGFLVATS